MSNALVKKRRLGIANAFKAASEHLADCRSDWHTSTDKYLNICACIWAARRKQKMSNWAAQATQAIIRQRLGDGCYYGDWVVEKVGRKAYINDQNNHDGRKTQDGRRRWLESLIKEFSK